MVVKKDYTVAEEVAVHRRCLKEWKFRGMLIVYQYLGDLLVYNPTGATKIATYEIYIIDMRQWLSRLFY